MLTPIADAAENLSRAILALRESEYTREALEAAREAERGLLDAMRDAGLAAVRVKGRLYVDIYAHHVADEDGEGLWSVAVIPPECISV